MKLKTLLFLLGALSVVVFSCSKDDDKPGSNSGDIVGTWNLQSTHMVLSESGTPVDDTTIAYTAGGDYVKITFNADQTFRSESSTDGEVETETGTYVYKNGKLTATPDSEGGAESTNPFYMTTLDCKITGIKMVLTASYSGIVNEENLKLALTVQAVKEQ